MRGDTPASARLRELQAQIAEALADLDAGRTHDAATRLRPLAVPTDEPPGALDPDHQRVGDEVADRMTGGADTAGGGPAEMVAAAARRVRVPSRARVADLGRAVGAATRELRTPDERSSRLTRAVRAFDTDPGAVSAARSMRRRLPGDAAYGDPLSLEGRGAGLLGQRIATVAGGTPSAARELAFSTLQVWEGLAGRRRGVEPGPVAVLFTDLVNFSGWVLEVGDPAALAALRRIGALTEPEITVRGGAVVKRLGDGLMAVFGDVPSAVDAALAVVARVETAGDGLRLRAGVHVGAPLRLGADFFGADVNIAARVGAAAGPGEVLVSDEVRALLPAGYRLRRLGGLRAKGVPRGVSLHRVERAGETTGGPTFDTEVSRQPRSGTVSRPTR
jgi:adenylate cyclase